MAVRKARCRCDTEMLKLKAAADCVTEFAATHTDDGRIPDALKANWVSFKDGH